MRLRIAIGSLVLLAACSKAYIVRSHLESRPHAVGCVPGGCSDSSPHIDVTYLGVSGILIEYEGHALLTAPFFTNPPLSSVARSARRLFLSRPSVSSDPAAIERLLPKTADHASAILVGHGHYDHLMDVPYIATRRAKGAAIYGGPSVRHMLMGDSALRAESARLVSIPLEASGTPDRNGQWFYTRDSAFRFMALVSHHAPTFRFLRRNYTFAGGLVEKDLDRLPSKAGDWKLGEAYSYIIDVLGGASHATIFRIYFQDAPSNPPLGFPPRELLADHAVDLAILCAATSSNVRATPDSLLRVLSPSSVLVTHWESFFRSQVLPEEINRTTDVDAFVLSLNRSLPVTATWAMPLPQTTFRFPVAVREWSAPARGPARSLSPDARMYPAGILPRFFGHGR